MLGEFAGCSAACGGNCETASDARRVGVVRFAIALLGASFALAGAAEASGTRAGTIITNTASVSYEIDGAAIHAKTNAAVLRVERAIAFNIEDVDVSIAGLLAFRIHNVGNDCVAPDLTASASDNSPTLIAIDSDRDGVFNADRDGRYAPAGASALCPDETLLAFVVLGDAAIDPVVTFRVGDAWRIAPSRKADAVQVALSKSQMVVDRPGATAVEPGDIIEYALRITATGAGLVDELVVDDPLPHGLTYLANSLTLNAASAPHGDETTPDAIRIRLGPSHAPFDHVLTFRARVQ